MKSKRIWDLTSERVYFCNNCNNCVDLRDIFCKWCGCEFEENEEKKEQ